MKIYNQLRSLAKKMLKKDPNVRFTAKQCLEHEALCNLKKRNIEFKSDEKIKLEIDEPEFSSFKIFRDEQKYSVLLNDMLMKEFG